MAGHSITRQQARDIDAYAINQLGIPGIVLMENAGRNLARRIASLLINDHGSVAIVAGSGNNGGDGFVAARHLVNMGVEATTFIVLPVGKIKGDALTNLDIIRKLGHDICDLSEDPSSLAAQLGGFGLVVDAIGGTGITGSLRGGMEESVKQINYSGRKVIAVDIPTGLDCDTGEADGAVIRAEMTVTFIARKKGFDAPGASEYTGEVVVSDIGIDPAAVSSML